MSPSRLSCPGDRGLCRGVQFRTLGSSLGPQNLRLSPILASRTPWAGRGLEAPGAGGMAGDSPLGRPRAVQVPGVGQGRHRAEAKTGAQWNARRRPHTCRGSLPILLAGGWASHLWKKGRLLPFRGGSPPALRCPSLSVGPLQGTLPCQDPPNPGWAGRVPQSRVCPHLRSFPNQQPPRPNAAAPRKSGVTWGLTPVLSEVSEATETTASSKDWYQTTWGTRARGRGGKRA